MAGKNTIDALEKGVRKLMDENRRLRDENGRLEARGERLKEENEALREAHSDEAKRVSVKGLAKKLGSREQVDKLIREVDACIELLNKE